MDIAKVRTLYQKGIAKGMPTLVPDNLQAIRTLRAAVAINELLDKYSYSPTLADIGCGNASILRLLHNCIRYTGIDIVPDFIVTANQSYPKQLFVEGTAIDLPEPKYNIVVCLGVLAHVAPDELETFLSDLYPKATDYTVLEVQDPSKYSGSFHAHSFESVSKALSQSGMRIDRVIPADDRDSTALLIYRVCH